MYNMQLNNSKTMVLRGLKFRHYAAPSGRYPLLAGTTTSSFASFYPRAFSVSTTHRAQEFSVKLKDGQTVRSPLGLFINNEFVPAASGATSPLIDPRTESPLCHVARAAKEDVDKAVHASNLALHQNKQWREMSQRERGNRLYRLADLVEENAEELALLESLNSGVSLAETKGFHIPFTVNCLRYYAGWADKLSGKTIPFPGRYLCFTKRDPVGVVGGIIPWNFPLMLLSWKFGPAVAAGNALVVKPSELTPLTALRFAELTREAGFPDGVFQVVPGYGKEAGDSLARHMQVDKVAFTGSTDTGRLIMKAAAERFYHSSIVLRSSVFFLCFLASFFYFELNRATTAI
ncbi:Aldehyde dehydrogenase, mitochondrial, variant 2 [Balamuthia mandrillaris]